MNDGFIELKCYIKYNHYYGHSLAEIKKILMSAGWDAKVIDEAIMQSRKESLVPLPKKH